MSAPDHTPGTPRPVRQPVLLGLFTGTAVGAGFLLAGVPNVELMTLVVALCGGVLGPGPGFVSGVVAAMAYSLGSPLGLPVPLLLGAQACGLGAAGVLGAWGGNRLMQARFKGRRAAVPWWAGITGAGSTLIFDLLTNLSIVGAFDAHLGTVLTGAVPFVLLHVGSNIVVFVLLMPVLLPRLSGLARPSLVGKGGAALLAALLLTVPGGRAQAQEPAPADTLATAEVDSVALVEKPGTLLPAVEGAAAAFGWQRPLWRPFARTALKELDWYSPLATVVDGGLGAPALLLGEAGTHRNPLFVRDGIPVGTGHELADDPWLAPSEGLIFAAPRLGADGWGGTGGLVETTTDDRDPEKAVSAYRGIKGRHETYFRGIHLLTPRAAWRVSFAFEESLDKEGYNFTGDPDALFAASSSNPFPGHSRVRQGRTRMVRELAPGRSLALEYGHGRLTKDALPARGAEHLELWDDHLAAVMRTPLGGWDLGARGFWRNRDVAWGSRSTTAEVGADLRLLETSLEGLAVDLTRPDGSGLALRASGWRVADSLADQTWLTGYSGNPAGSGENARAIGRLVLGPGPWRLEAEAGADWASHGGAGPAAGLALAVGSDAPWLRLGAELGGRSPRSDELLTPLRRDVAGRELVLLPNRELDREQTVRVAAALRMRLMGLDLAVDASARRLRDGIGWLADPGDPDSGTWDNALELDSTRLTARVGHEGRFLGWARIMVEGTWQDSTEKAGHAAWLPPETLLRAHVMWENHFFKEDGILQIALISTARGEMADPWDVTREALLASRTVHDLLVGFRLVGAHLGLGFRNLTGERTVMTSGAVSPGQELDMRLGWAWLY